MVHLGTLVFKDDAKTADHEPFVVYFTFVHFKGFCCTLLR